MPIEKISEMLAFASPLRVYLRSDSLVVLDYRPTWIMALAGAGTLVFAVGFLAVLIKFDTSVDSFGLWATGILSLSCVVFALRGSLREAYYFDTTSDSYRFERQYVYRKDVIEGSLDQFKGAYVKTVEQDDSEIYQVVLQQEGMFLTGVTEQTLREDTPLFNSFSNEARIANAISSIISVARHARSRKG